MAEKKEEAKPAAVAAAKGGKKSRLKLIVAVIVLLCAGGGGAWWYSRSPSDDPAPEAKAAPTLPPVFVAMDPFTVNLQPEAVGNQYMQVGITLKITGQPMADKLKDQMPEVRSRLLMILSEKRASELLAPNGKQKLARELLSAVNLILDPATAANRAGAAQTPGPVSVASAAAETRTDATDQAPETAEPAEAGVAAPAAEPAAEPVQTEAPAAPRAETGPVLSVLFTAFIIQ